MGEDHADTVAAREVTAGMRAEVEAMEDPYKMEGEAKDEYDRYLAAKMMSYE